MATIKIYDANDLETSIEIGNEGENEPGQLVIYIDHSRHKGLLYFDLSKEDARELIVYLKKQFSINP